jgi:hypothetical protein
VPPIAKTIAAIAGVVIVALFAVFTFGRNAPPPADPSPPAASPPATPPVASGNPIINNPKLKTLPTDSAAVGELLKEDITVGSGAEAVAGKLLSMHYTGLLLDGSKFDSSLDRSQPLAFTLGQGQVIAGWDQGILGMKVGGKRRLTIPANLAYGANPPTPAIPPNSALVFEVELLEVK